MLPPAPPEIDWNSAVAFRWRKRQGRGFLQPVPNLSPLSLDDLCNIERQKGLIEQNTRQFVRKSPANNVLLTGARYWQVIADQGVPERVPHRRVASDRSR